MQGNVPAFVTNLLPVWATILAVFCAGFAIFHVLLIVGAPLGEFILGGKHKILPRRMRFLSGFFVIYFSVNVVSYLLIAQSSNLLFVKICLVVNSIFQLYACFGNLFSQSRLEKLAMEPLAILSTILNVLILLSVFWA